MSVKRKVTVPVRTFFKSGLLASSGAASQSNDTFGGDGLPSAVIIHRAHLDFYHGLLLTKSGRFSGYADMRKPY